MHKQTSLMHRFRRAVSVIMLMSLFVTSTAWHSTYAADTSASVDMSIAPPSGVSASNAGEGKAVVTWNMPPYSADAITKSIDGFIIQKKLHSEDDSSYTQTGVYYLPSGTPPSSMSYTVTGLTEDVYDFRVVTLSKLTDRLNQIIKSRTDCSDDGSDGHKCKAKQISITATALPIGGGGGGGSSGNGSSAAASTASSAPSTAAPSAPAAAAPSSESSTAAPSAPAAAAPSSESSTAAPSAPAAAAPSSESSTTTTNSNTDNSSSTSNAGSGNGGGMTAGSSSGLSEALADLGSSLSAMLGMNHNASTAPDSATTAKNDTQTVVQETVGTKDSDGDGLSDLLEINTYHTDPNKADTDGDGLSDGEEALEFGTDPLNVEDGKPTNITPKITNIADTKVLNDATPTIKGVAPVNTTLTVIAEKADHTIIKLGTVQSDAAGKWLMTPSVELTSGKYTLKITDGNDTVYDAKNITIDLAFVLPPPEITNTDAQKQDDQGRPIFNSAIPEFQGNTYYGSTVTANFQSLLMSTSIIADNPEGDFAIRPPKALEAGHHTLTLYAELPDGTRSTARIVKFTVDPSLADATNKPSVWLALLTMKNIVLVFLVLNFTFLLYETIKELQPKRPKRKFAI